MRASQVERVIIAGAFGTYLHLASALAIGMFPELPEDRFQQVGNAAGAGARMMLVSKKARQEAIEVQKQMRYIELTTVRTFQDIYMAALPVTSQFVISGGLTRFMLKYPATIIGEVRYENQFKSGMDILSSFCYAWR